MLPRRSPWRRAALPAALLAACSLLAGCLDLATAQETATPVAPDLITAPAAPAVAGALPSAPATASPAIDWKALAYHAAGCLSRDDWARQGIGTADWDAATVQTRTADVTGDGTPEVLVQLACPTQASSQPDQVVVLTATAAGPDVIGVLSGDVSFRGATVSTDGTTVTLSGPSVAGGDPRCCPAHWATASYRWRGGQFVLVDRLEALTTQPIRREAPVDGRYVGIVRGVGAGELLVDVIDWFEGADATRACRADGVANHGDEWCNAYYFRNADDLVRTVPVADGASLGYLNLTTGEPVHVRDVADLAGTPAVSDSPDIATFFRFTVQGGAVTDLEQIFVP